MSIDLQVISLAYELASCYNLTKIFWPLRKVLDNQRPPTCMRLFVLTTGATFYYGFYQKGECTMSVPASGTGQPDRPGPLGPDGKPFPRGPLGPDGKPFPRGPL